MERLHAYWRMDFVEAPLDPDDGNPFQELPEKPDHEAFIIHRGETIYLMLNRFPYNAGHLLAVPFRQVNKLSELFKNERSELMETIVLGQNLLTEAFEPDGFNVGFNMGNAGGATLSSHLHCHIVPRWEGDTNFMPVIATTRVLPASLEAIWKRLREVFTAQNSS